MKTILSNTILILFTLIFFGSCTMQKRLYNSGYYVQWHHKKTKRVKRVETNIPKHRLISIDIVQVKICSFPKHELLSLATLNARPESDSSKITKKKLYSKHSNLQRHLINNLFEQYQFISSKPNDMTPDRLKKSRGLTKGKIIALIMVGVIVQILFAFLLILLMFRFSEPSGFGMGELTWI